MSFNLAKKDFFVVGENNLGGVLDVANRLQ